jgi:ATP-dependent DNA ligase
VDRSRVGHSRGKTRESVPTIVSKGKNLGKASQTNVWTQALRDAYGLYNKQEKKSDNQGKLIANGPKVSLFPPMLAQIYNEQKTSPMRYGDVFVQRKYNGVRTVTTFDTTNDSVVMYSRRKNIYPGFDYIKQELYGPLKSYWAAGRKLYLDGEIYKHGVPLQDISGIARREKDPQLGQEPSETREEIKYDYMIYDCFFIGDGVSMEYLERKKVLDNIFSTFAFTYSKPVETIRATTNEEVIALYNKFLAGKFEGAMVRLNKEYQFSYNERHSKYLLKIKPCLDAEMEIVAYTTGTKGKAANAIMIICRTPEGKQFPVTPAMKIEERIALTKAMGVLEPNGRTHFENQWLGKKIIIYFDEKSKDNVPQRARTKMKIRTWD